MLLYSSVWKVNNKIIQLKIFFTWASGILARVCSDWFKPPYKPDLHKSAIYCYLEWIALERDEKMHKEFVTNIIQIFDSSKWDNIWNAFLTFVLFGLF